MRFCGYCGGRLDDESQTAPASPPPPDEDRRLVTVLFCDLVGFTPLSEQLDAEDVREIQDEYFGRMSGEIHRYGGTVEKYAGDAVLAIFGSPVAHEDDAERAVHCGLAMLGALRPLADSAREHWGIDLALRIGVNTGEVVSGIRETEGRSDYAVTGDVVNTAARYQASAAPGTILAGAETMRLARRSVLFGDFEELELKGKTGTVAAYPVRGLREQVVERWEVTRDRTLLVGRQRELETLLGAWGKAQAGMGQLVSLVAEAGVGKSRLLAETLERIASTGGVQLVRGRCLSYTQGIGLWLIADLLRSLLGVHEQDPPKEVRQRTQAAIDSLLTEEDDQSRSMAADVLGEVLGLPPGASVVAQADARTRHRVMVRSLRLILTAMSKRDPAAIALEDLHWIDPASREVLLEVMSDLQNLRIFCVAALRPERHAPFLDWPWVCTIELQPLAEEDVPALARAVLGGAELSPELEREIAERTGGNPFFVEELLRSLEEAGGLQERGGHLYLAGPAAERLPSTLTGLLQARLDGLERESRSVAQVGSVIGRRFAVRVLSRVAMIDEQHLQRPLEELERAALAFPRWSAELEYVFKHAVIQEVTYGSLLVRRRQQLHAEVARTLILLYPGDELVDVIAYHYGRSQEWREAAHWLERAGDRAADVYANETARTHYEEARKRLERGAEPLELARLDEKLSIVLGRIECYDEAVEVGERTVEGLQAAGNLEAVGTVTALIGRWHALRGAPQDGLARVHHAIALLEGADAPRSLASLYSTLASINFVAGEYQESLDAATRASEYSEIIGDARIQAQTEMHRGVALSALGRLEESRLALEGAIPLAEAVGDIDRLSRLLVNLGGLYGEAGDLQQSRLHYEHARIYFERLGAPGIEAHVFLAFILTLLGEWTSARDSLANVNDLVRARGASWVAPYVSLFVGRLDMLSGDWEVAAPKLHEGVSRAESTGDRQALGFGHWFLGELDILRERPDRARVRLEAHLPREVWFKSSILATLAHAYLELGDLRLAEETVTEAVTIARNRQHRLHLPEALRIQGLLRAVQLRWDEANQAYDIAASLAGDMRYPYAQALALQAHGTMLQKMEATSAAGAALERARRLFHQLGAAKDADRTEAVLAALSGTA